MTVAPVIRSQRTHVWLKRQQVDLRPLGVTLGGQDVHLRLELRHAREAQRQEGRLGYDFERLAFRVVTDDLSRQSSAARTRLDGRTTAPSAQRAMSATTAPGGCVPGCCVAEDTMAEFLEGYHSSTCADVGVLGDDPQPARRAQAPRNNTDLLMSIGLRVVQSGIWQWVGPAAGSRLPAPSTGRGSPGTSARSLTRRACAAGK